MIVIESYQTDKTYKNQKKFDCGNAVINKFAAQSLKSQVRKHLSKAYVLTGDQDSFMGFYTLCAFSLIANQFDGFRNAGLPASIPCIRLIMLGVDKNYQKLGYGRDLLVHAIDKMLEAAQHIGVYGLYLDAEPKAVDFYLKHAFTLLYQEDRQQAAQMFLPIQTVRGL